jgi:signal transduction histidine kinase/CheY-like chemotaxis protein
LIFQHRRADGSVRDVEVHSGPIPFEGRTALFSIVHDVTERRQAEEALHGRTYGLQTLLEASRNLAITLDLDTVLQATTDGVAKLFGLDTAAIYLLEGDVLCLGATTPPLPSNFPEELRNAQLSDHPLIRKTITTGTPTLVPDMRTADLTPAERSVAEQRGLRTVLYFPLVVGVKSVGTLIVGSIERTRVVKDAEIDLCRTLANLAALAVENARLYESRKQYAARLSQQITEHRMLEDQLRQSQKMESIGTLAGGVAHDFNNLLTAINGYGHIALLKMAKDDPNRLNVEQILEATDRAAHLTKDLLLFSRKQPLDRKPLDLNDIVRRLERFIARIIGEDITCATRLQAGEIPVLVDGHQLEQVLMNLATNARDAMAKGGVLTLATETMTIDETFVALHGYGRPGRYALLTVADTGCGMDPEVRKRIFEPFYTTKEVGKGTGLGLAVVYGIVTQHEGFMNVYSEPGSGTTFQIYLLLTGARGDTSLDRSRVADIARGNETILVAEDDAAVRGMIESVLRDFGYTVITAVDGADAVEKYRANSGSIQLLLLDLVMPHKSGREAFDEIVAITPGVSVLFASGYSPDIVRDKASLLAAAEIIYKPVTPGELLRKIRGMLDEKQGT